MLDRKQLVLDIIPGACSGAGSTPPRCELSAGEHGVVSNAIIDQAFDEQIQLA
ncbi:MAG: hypothetical protein AB1714_02325 [Acidobacteriota bacterium]